MINQERNEEWDWLRKMWNIIEENLLPQMMVICQPTVWNAEN